MSVLFALLPGPAFTWCFQTRERVAEAQAQTAQCQATENQLRRRQSQLEQHLLFNTLARRLVPIALDPARAQAMLDCFEAAGKPVRVVTAGCEHLIRLPLKDLLAQLDPQAFWQVHGGTMVLASCIAQTRREESGKLMLTLASRPETLAASQRWAHRLAG